MAPRARSSALGLGRGADASPSLSSFLLAQAPEQQGLRILLRVGLRDTLIGLAYFAVAAILARLDLSSRFGRRLLLSGFGFYGVALLMNAAVIWVDRFAGNRRHGLRAAERDARGRPRSISDSG
ncbi:MAG: hypothetical protein RML12_05690 [Xanthomonadales bacterium]|nr:hypothetical protein [Xanthomonadales bacterium]